MTALPLLQSLAVRWYPHTGAALFCLDAANQGLHKGARYWLSAMPKLDQQLPTICVCDYLLSAPDAHAAVETYEVLQLLNSIVVRTKVCCCLFYTPVIEEPRNSGRVVL